jgi:nitrogen regulatory protein PII
MKYVVAIIQPDRLDSVIEALTEEEINLMTVSEVLGRGRQKGLTEVYRSHREPGNLLRKIKVEVAIRDDRLWQVVDAVRRGAYTGTIGDGKIFVFNLDECIRIRTGETGEAALA